LCVWLPGFYQPCTKPDIAFPAAELEKRRRDFPEAFLQRNESAPFFMPLLYEKTYSFSVSFASFARLKSQQGSFSVFYSGSKLLNEINDSDYAEWE